MTVAEPEETRISIESAIRALIEAVLQERGGEISPSPQIPREPVPYGLATVADVAYRCGVNEQRLMELAEAGLAPHYRVDGRVYFKRSEIYEWVKENLTQHVPGDKVPWTLQVWVNGLPRPGQVPAALARIEGLQELPPIPALCGIYFLCSETEVLYVGQSVVVQARIAQHVNDGKEFTRAFFLPVAQSRLLEVEGAMIRALQPPLNRTNKTGAIYERDRDWLQGLGMLSPTSEGSS